MIWLLPFALTVCLSSWVGTRLVRANAPGRVPLFRGASTRPPAYAWTQALLLVMALLTAYIREKGLSETHATSWVFGVLAAYVPFLVVDSAATFALQEGPMTTGDGCCLLGRKGARTTGWSPDHRHARTSWASRGRALSAGMSVRFAG